MLGTVRSAKVADEDQHGWPVAPQLPEPMLAAFYVLDGDFGEIHVTPMIGRAGRFESLPAARASAAPGMAAATRRPAKNRRG